MLLPVQRFSSTKWSIKPLYSELVDSLRTAASDSEYKTRWVDQTPEYSFHICGLRKLFPCALFIHIVRDVGSVVRSMLNFHRIAGTHVVPNEEEAYKYWLRTVRACLKAEEAYGPHVIYRLRYSALVENPESALRSLLDFLGEPYSAKCLEPLSERINSSNVPDDFKSEDPATDPAIVEEARRLSVRDRANLSAYRALTCRSRRVGGRVRCPSQTHGDISIVYVTAEMETGIAWQTDLRCYKSADASRLVDPYAK